jgi:uncharacterized protein (TIGR03437 family)
MKLRQPFIAVLWAVMPITLQAQTLTTLWSFDEFTSGAGPRSALVQGNDGNFYGESMSGGGYGNVFKITPAGNLTIVHAFCTSDTCADGRDPKGGLILGTDGNLYGTTSSGGVSGFGTVFKITTTGVLTTLYNFSGDTHGGANPNRLTQGRDGNIYGITLQGGKYRLGAVFKITPAGVFTTLFSFGSNTTDGSSTLGWLVQADDGNFYGTTNRDGAHLYGTVFRITPTEGDLTTIYSFGAVIGTYSSAADGAYPSSGLTLGTDGSLYGTTSTGGANSAGAVFKITKAGALSVLYNFCATQLPNCATDGYSPYSGVIQAADGNLYGTALQGGAQNYGTIFKVTRNGEFTLLHSFASKPDGYSPAGGLVQGADGNIYGTTEIGGATNISQGTVFRLQLTTTAPYTCSNTTSPTILSVGSASAYGAYPYFASGSWLEIKGTNLADPTDPRLKASTSPGQWTSSDFNGVNAPTSLDGLSVSINGKPAYVWYLSPGQLNVQAPADAATGNVAITVTNCKATSSPFTFTRQTLAPGLLAPSNYSSAGKQYLVATFASDGAYVLSTGLGASFGLTSRPAKPGDVIIAYGIGFGDVTPSIGPGVIAQLSNTLTNPVMFSFGSTPASLSYSGLAGGFVGLYEFYITVPPSLISGDYQINVAQNGTRLPQTLYLTVQN